MPLSKIADFSVSYLQVLDPEGNVDASSDPGLPEKDLVRLYSHMVFTRRADDRMLKLQRQGRIGTFGPCTGQEAAHCAPVFAASEKDWVVISFREIGAMLMRGWSLSHLLVYWNGYEEGNMNPAGSRTLPITVIVGSQCLHAVGLGYAAKYRGEKNTGVIVFFGDGATSQGDFHEALNFASVWQVPVIFICQNNQWAISTPRNRQTHSRTIAQKAIAYDMPGIQVDGNDPLAMVRATREALDRAYAGGGPTLIEAVTYRLLMHTTADDPKKYRREEEVEEWWKRDPLKRFRIYLERKGYWDSERQSTLEAEVERTIDGEVKAFESPREFKPDASFDHTFGTTHAVIEEQRAEFLERHRSAPGSGRAGAKEDRHA